MPRPITEKTCTPYKAQTHNYPTYLNALRNPLNPSIVSLRLVSEFADLDRRRAFVLTCAAPGTSR